MKTGIRRLCIIVSRLFAKKKIYVKDVRKMKAKKHELNKAQKRFLRAITCDPVKISVPTIRKAVKARAFGATTMRDVVDRAMLERLRRELSE